MSRPRDTRKRIAIIGAGCSGLAAIKCCLDEGLEPLCLEKSNDLGGLWNFAETSVVGSASIYKSLVINTSKDMMMFSDFPPPENFPPFLTHAKVLEYFRLYSDRFDLLPYISFNTEVKAIQKADDYDVTGRWCVTFVLTSDSKADDVKRGVLRQEVFDGVMICTGHHSVPFIPNIIGLDTFQGEVLHSHSYKEPGDFDGKRVVIVGIGNSAMDIACDLAKTAAQVTIASRRGAWIVPKTSFWGLPADTIANSRAVFTLPYAILDWCVQIQANFRLDHATYGLRPEHGVLNCHPCINDELPIHLVNGRVVAKVNVNRVDTDGVWLEDGQFCPCDVIILATGYDYKMDFLHPAGIKVENNRVDLYKYVFPTHLPHPTLAVIGLIQAIGAVMPIAEMQSRWFAHLMTGKAKLPVQESMVQDIAAKRQAMEHLYVKSRRHTMQSFWIAYMDDIASLIGAKPNLRKMLLRDPELALKCYLGPCLPAQFRLQGTNQWSGARSFILNAMTRVSKSALSRQRSKATVKAIANDTSRADEDTSMISPIRKEDETCKSSPDHAASARSQVGQAASYHHGNQSLPQGRGGRPSRYQRSPEWMSMTFYVVILLTCCLAWLLSVLLSKAEWLINFLDQTVGRYMPLSD